MKRLYFCCSFEEKPLGSWIFFCLQDPNSSGDVDVKWSPVAVVIKMKPPKIPAGIIVSRAKM